MKKSKLTPLKAVRRKCLDCTGGRRSEVRNCGDINCPLYEYRFGTNWRRKGIGGRRAKGVSKP